MSKHTAGPWEAVGNLVRSPMCQPEGLPRGVQIAECRDSYFLLHTDEARANARLVSAAPDLLEALKLAVRQNSHDMVMTSEELRKCEAAVAKATGAA